MYTHVLLLPWGLSLRQVKPSVNPQKNICSLNLYCSFWTGMLEILKSEIMIPFGSSSNKSHIFCALNWRSEIQNDLPKDVLKWLSWDLDSGLCLVKLKSQAFSTTLPSSHNSRNLTSSSQVFARLCPNPHFYPSLKFAQSQSLLTETQVAQDKLLSLFSSTPDDQENDLWKWLGFPGGSDGKESETLYLSLGAVFKE